MQIARRRSRSCLFQAFIRAGILSDFRVIATALSTCQKAGHATFRLPDRID
jgi:hypothetical protein